MRLIDENALMEMKASEYMKERYYFLKNHGMCVRCGNEKAERNHVTCYECSCYLADKQEEKRASLTIEEKIRKNKIMSKYNKELYHKRKSEGLCVRCGQKNNNGKTLCHACLRKKSNLAKSKRRAEGKITREERGNGTYCEMCCTMVETKGQKLCNSCFEKACINLGKARQAAPKNNYFRQGIDAFWRMRGKGNQK